MRITRLIVIRIVIIIFSRGFQKVPDKNSVPVRNSPRKIFRIRACISAIRMQIILSMLRLARYRVFP